MIKLLRIEKGEKAMDKLDQQQKIINQVRENRKKFRVDHFDIVLSEYYRRYKEEDVILDPPYQRSFRWNAKQQSELIESILIGIPLPPIFAFSNSEYQWEIIDGLQRTTTFFKFFEGKLKIEGCSILESINNHSINELPKSVVNAIKNARIRIELVEDTADSYSQYLLFSRLNNNGEPLSDQELRNFLIYKINESYYDSLSEIRERESVKGLLQLSKKRNEKQEDVEYILRFSIIKKHLVDKKKYEKYKSVSELITVETERFLTDLENDVSAEVENLEKVFDYLYQVLGEKGYKTFHTTLNSVVNTSIIGPVLGALADEDINYRIDNATMRNYIMEFYNSQDYKRITKRSYSPTKRFFELGEVAYDFFKRRLR